MSTINNVVLDADSEDEDDPDFVPDEQSESSDEERSTTLVQTVPETMESEAERAAQKAAREALWECFQSSVADTNGRIPSNLEDESKQAKLVKIEKKYRFAGEEVSEVVEVPEDSEETKRWPLWKPPLNVKASTVETGTSTSSIPCNPVPLTSNAPPTACRRPGPRKPKTTLTPLPSKPKKLTTLEKSAMDWNAHVSGAALQNDTTSGTTLGTDNLADELERNRRGGGYLEKVAFLERVGDRREALFEGSRSKRRKT